MLSVKDKSYPGEMEIIELKDKALQAVKAGEELVVELVTDKEGL